MIANLQQWTKPRALGFLTGRLWTRALVIMLAVWSEILIAAPLRGGQNTVAASVPIPVRLIGKMYLTPAGDKGRHKDLLALGLSPEQIVYLQVDDFHTASKDRGELAVLEDMQRYKPCLRVINGEALAAVLNDETLRGKRVAVNGFLYQVPGLLLVAEIHVEEEKNAQPPPASSQSEILSH